MCRHLGWLGRPRTLAELVLVPEFSLLRQSWAPRRQRHGTVNADGWGVGFYARFHGRGWGTQAHAPALEDEVAAVLRPMGLRLSAEKTMVAHFDKGFDFLGGLAA